MNGSALTRALAVGAQGPTAPAFRVRAVLPAGELRRFGVELTPLPLFSPELDHRFQEGSLRTKTAAVLRARRSLRHRLGDELADCDAVFVQRQVDLLPSLTLERQVTTGRRTVLDVDDAIWLDTSPPAGGHPLAFLKGSERKIRWLAQRADHVIAGNEVLAEWLSDHAERVDVIPSLVSPSDVPLRRHEDTRRIVLGWIGSRTTAVHLRELRALLAKLPARAPDLKWELAVMGGTFGDLPGMDVRQLPWSLPGERELLKRMDIGLMPLPDNDWTRGKCAYKALVYMSAGIPVVADGVGATADIVGDGESGLIAYTRDEWSDLLLSLARDTAARARLGAAGRRRTEDEFSTRRWAPRLARILTGD